MVFLLDRISSSSGITLTLDDIVDASGPAGQEQVRLGDVLADLVAQGPAMGIDLAGAEAKTTSVDGDFPLAGDIYVYEMVFGANGCGTVRTTAEDAVVGVPDGTEVVRTRAGMVESAMTKADSAWAIAIAFVPETGLVDYVIYDNLDVALVGEVGMSDCRFFSYMGIPLMSYHEALGFGVITDDAETGVLPAPI